MCVYNHSPGITYVRNYPLWGQNYGGVKEQKDEIRQMTKFCEKHMSEWMDIGAAAFVTEDFNWDDNRKNPVQLILLR